MSKKNRNGKTVEPATVEKESSDVVTEETTEETEETIKEAKETTEETEKDPEKIEYNENTVFISFFKVSEDSEWQMFPKISSTPEQAENRIKAHVSTVEIHVVPVELP